MKKTSLEMDENVEALLSYVLGFITGIIFLILEKKSNFVRFHAAQSLVVFLALSIGAWIFSFIPFIGIALVIIIEIISFVLWILLMYEAYEGKMFEVPVAADIAKKLVR